MPAWRIGTASVSAEQARNRCHELEEEGAKRSLRAVISWARRGEAFAYNRGAGIFNLDHPT